MRAVHIEASGYVPRQRPSEDPVQAQRRVRRRLVAATHYLLYSDRQGVGEERTLFADDAGNLPLQEARARIAASYGPAAAFHRLVLSPNPDLGFATDAQTQRWARMLLRRTNTRIGRQLVWVGAVHRDTAVPHAHLIVAGADTAGTAVRVRTPLLRWMEEAGAQIAGAMAAEQEARRTRLEREG